MRLTLYALALVLLGGSTPASAAVATIYNLDGTISVGSAINASGQFAGSNGHHAIRYTGIPGSGGVLEDLGTLGGAGSWSNGIGINASGQVAGTSGIGGSMFISHAFRYTGIPGSGGFMADLGTLGGANSWSESGGINVSGQVAGTSGSAVIVRHAFRYTGMPGSGGAMADLGTLGGSESIGFDINTAGQVVGYSSTTGDNAYHAFLYTGTPGSGGAMVDLGTLAGKAYSFGVTINDHGQVAGYCHDDFEDGGERAFLYTGTPGTGGAMWDLGSFDDGRSRAWGMNANGQVVGSSESAFGEHAFLYTGTPGVDGHMIDLDAWLDTNNPTEGAKWTLDTAYHLNDTGLITGWGWYDDGQGLGEVIRFFLLDASALVVPQPGDFNSDGKVDAADYVVWRKSNGSQGDYNTWRSHFGQPAGSGAALPSAEPLSAAVPEPATVVLFGVGLAVTFGALSQRSKSRRARHRANHRHAVRRPRVEPLEDRCLLSFSSAISPPPEDPDAQIVWAPPPPLVADFTSDGILDKISSNFHEVLVRPGRNDGTFGDPIRTSIQMTPGAPLLAVADFNGDNRLDVFTAAAIDFESPPKVNVILGLGDGRFILAESFSVGTVPTMIGTGEIFGTGRTDVAIAGYDYLSKEHGVLALFNDGLWWTPSPALPGDYNGNDEVDAADYVVWRKNNGTTNALPDDPTGGTIGTAQFNQWRAHFGQMAGSGSGTSASAAVPEPATVVLVGVGLLAVVCAFSDRTWVRLRKRQGDHRHPARRPEYERLEDRCLLSFSPAVSYSVGSTPQSVVTADFNNDGRLDVAVANSSSNSVSVLLGNIAGTFQPAQTFVTGASPVSIAVGNFNADSRLDLVTANYSDNTFSVLLGNGQGGFSAPIYTTVNVHPQAMAVGDFNADGKLDVVTASGTVSVSGQSRVSMRSGNGDGTFGSVGAYIGLFGESLSLATGDFNADGKLDLVASTTDSWISDYGNEEVHVGRVIVLPGNGLGYFGESHYYYLRSWFPGDLTVGDLNSDGKLDVVTANEDSDTVSVLLGNGDGTLSYSYNSSDFATGGTPTSVALGDFNRDGGIDVVTANLGSNDVSVLRGHSDGTFSAAENFSVGTGASAIAGDLNSDGNVDAADYVVWRKTCGTQEQYDAWRAHFGQFADMHPFAIIAGDSNGDGWLDVATANSNGNSISVLINDHSWGTPLSIVAPLTTLAEPEQRDAIEPHGAIESDGAPTVVDPQLPLFIPQGPRHLRRPRALPTTDSGMKARGNDLLLVRSSAARFDQQPSKRGLNSLSIDDSTEEAVETRRKSLDIAFTTLEHAEWQLGGNMLRRVWAGLWFAFVLFIGVHAKATPVVVYTNFGPGDSVANSVHDVLNQQGYAEHAARFFVPMGTNFTFTGLDVPISDTLAENERIESQLSIRLWSNDSGQPGTLLESMTTDVIHVPPGYLIQHVDSTSNTTLLQNNYYWISLAAIHPGRVDWFVNNTETGGYALKWPTSGAAWLVIDTAEAGAFRVFGEPAPVPEPTTMYLGTMAAIGMRWRKRRRGVSPVRI